MVSNMLEFKIQNTPIVHLSDLDNTMANRSTCCYGASNCECRTRIATELLNMTTMKWFDGPYHPFAPTAPLPFRGFVNGSGFITNHHLRYFFYFRLWLSEKEAQELFEATSTQIIFIEFLKIGLTGFPTGVLWQNGDLTFRDSPGLPLSFAKEVFCLFLA